MEKFTTEYREQSRKNNVLSEDGKSKKVHEFYDKVTPAGKSQYLPKPVDQEIISPEHLKNEELEEAIRKVWKSIQLDPMLTRKMESTMVEEVETEDSHSHLANPTGQITDMHLHDLNDE